MISSGNTGIYAVVNAVVFCLVFVEILIQIVYSLFSKQKIKRYDSCRMGIHSDYFQFLMYSLWWTLLRGLLSIPALTKNPKIASMMQDLLFPAIVSSFVLILDHYIKVAFFTVFELDSE